MKTVALFQILALPILAAPRYVTLLPGDRFLVKEGETAELVSSVYCYTSLWLGGTNVTSVNAWNRQEVRASPFVVAGVAEVRADLDESSGPGHHGFLTLRIFPEVVDPSTTAVVGPTTNSVTVRLQSSTNLVDWSTSASVTLTNVPTGTFFRARVVE